MDRSGTDDESIVGDIAHIVAQVEDSDAAARSVPTLSAAEREQYAPLIAERDKYSNLILLCKNHHKQVDDQPSAFPIESLLKLKRDHEEWVRQSLGTFDEKKQRDDEQYADYVDTWVKYARPREWMQWTSGIFSSGQPSLSKESDANLEYLRTWLLNRVWPYRYPSVEDAFTQFRWVLEDFHGLFREYAQSWGDRLLTEKFYKRAYDAPFGLRFLHYQERRYDYHVYLVEDLGLELTRAANRVCDEVRANLDPTFMLSEGRLMIQEGPGMDLKWTAYVAEYRPSEKYAGLDAFKSERKTRKECFGHDGKELPPFEEWAADGAH
jgi:hypothetical protein